MKCKKIIGTMLSLATVLSMFVVPAKAATVNVNEDFDGGQNTDGAAITSINGVSSFTVSGKDYVTVAVDPDTGSRALRFQAWAGWPYAKLEIDLDGSGMTGDYELSFDFKAKKHSGFAEWLAQPVQKKNNGSLDRLNFTETTGDTFWYCYRNSKYTGFTAQGESMNNFKSGYVTIKYIFHTDTNKFDMWVGDNQVAVNANYYYSTGTNGGGIYGIKFSFGRSTVTTTNGSDSGEPAQYWVDNLIFRKVPFKMTSSTPAAGATAATAGNNIQMTFDTNLKAETFTTSTVSLYEGTTKLAADKYSVSATGATLTVTPVGGLKYATDYTVKVANTVECTVVGTPAMAEGYEVSFTTQELIPAFAANVLEDLGMYNEGYTINLQTPGISYDILVDEVPYVTSPELAVVPVGTHTVKVIATEDATGKTQEKEYAIEVVAAIAPEASDVTITGDPITGTTLTGSYIYSDVNDVSVSKQGATKIQWTKATNEAGPYTAIPGATSLTYELTEADEDHYIRLEILPVSTEAPYSPAEPYVQGYSAPFKGDFKPTIVDDEITITGTVKDGETLTGSAVHQDENAGQIEGGSVMGWYKALTADGPFTEQISNTADLVIDENLHKDCYLQFVYTPKSAVSPAMGKTYKSEPIESIFTPELIGVKLIGEAKVGKTLGVSYVFVDENEDAEKEIQYQWYVGTTPVSTNSTYTLPQGTVGQSVYCEVTPVSTEKPYEGVAVATEVVTIGAGKTTGGGGGGGGGVYLPPSNNTDKDETTTPDIPVTPDTPDTPVTPPAPSTDFSDMQGHWATKEVEELVEMGIINGISPNEFGPSKVVTRAQCATMIARALGLEEADAINFGDVPADAWYYDAVALIATSGIMQGSANQFRPDAGMTRQELAAILARCIDTDVELTETEFSDNADIADWAKAEIEKAVALGLMKGTDGKFLPNKVATRAETAVCIWRLLEIMKGAAE